MNIETETTVYIAALIRKKSLRTGHVSASRAGGEVVHRFDLT